MARLTPAVIVTSLALVAGTGTARAQPPPTFADLPRQVAIGDRITVDDTAGGRYTGRLLSMSAEVVVVDNDTGRHTFTPSSTLRIARRGDTVLNGLLMGFVPGFFLGTQFVSGFSDHGESMRTFVTFGGIVGAVGAAFGSMIDSLHEGSTNVFVARPRVSAGPVLSSHAVTASVAIRW